MRNEPGRSEDPSSSEINPPPGKTPNTLRTLAGKMLLALAATALTLAAGEGTVRTLYPEYGIPVFSTKLFTEYDPLLGWRKIPNFRGTHVQKEYTIIERFNSKGLRGPEYPYRKPDGEYRILILGDSFAEGYTVEFQDLFSELLKRQLNAELERRVEVINAGTGGYSTDQELLFFRTEGRKYEPDLVIVLYCDNDAPMNLKNYYNTWDRGQKPLFELTDGKLSLKSTPEKTWDRTEEAEKDRAGHAHDYKKSFLPWKLDTWYLFRLCKHVMARRTEDLPAGGPIEPDAENAGEEKPWAETGYRGRQAEWVMTEALMAQIQKEASDIGSEFLLFNIPSKSEVYGPKTPDKAIENNLRVLSSRHDMPFIPTVDLFRNQAESLESSGKRLYWKQDYHWTPEGHRLAARILTQHLQARREDYGL
jgi:hypothetical protein